MPNSVLTRQRSWVARIAVLALFASLLVMGAVPAGAAGHINDTSASCPSSIPSAGFTDIATYDATTQAAINCIAEYGITKGTSATTYGPAISVARWQMALFLTRQAAAHGVTLPSGADQGFTDIGTLDAETRTAINQLAQLGVSKGTSATTFSPLDNVTREQMALFLARLLSAVTTLPASPADAGFTDIAGLTAESQLAINQLAAVGVAAGTSATTYAPAADVLRWQMALFLTRVLAEDGIVPSGLSLTASKTAAFSNEEVVLTISVKDGNTPIEGQRVDVFVAGSFNTNGTANIDADATLDIAGDAGTGTDATIDVSDPQTNAAGQIVIDLTHAAVAETDTVVVWVGDVGDTFDTDTVAAGDMKMVDITWSLGAVAIDGPASYFAKFGTQETIKAQLEDTNGDAVALAGEDVKFTVTRGGSTIVLQNVKTDATGAASFSYTGPADPTSGADNDAFVPDSISILWDKDGDGIADAGEPTDSLTLSWDDNTAVATNLKLTQSAPTSLISTSVTVTATVTDQYGDPVSGLEVEFDPASIGSGHRTTNASGVASFTYAGPAADAADQIDVDVDVNDDGSFTGELDDDITHYWVKASGDDATVDGDILEIGSNYVDLDTTGGSTDGYIRVTWDSGDQFNVAAAGKTMDEFVASLDDGDNVTVNYDDTASAVSVWNNVTG